MGDDVQKCDEERSQVRTLNGNYFAILCDLLDYDICGGLHLVNKL